MCARVCVHEHMCVCTHMHTLGEAGRGSKYFWCENPRDIAERVTRGLSLAALTAAQRPSGGQGAGGSGLGDSSAAEC